MYPTVNPGDLRHPISIYQRGPAPVGVAGAKVQRVLVTTAMASIIPVRGTDVIKSGQATTQLFLTLKIWYQPGLAPNMEVDTEGGSTYLIQSIENPLEMNVLLVLNCLGLGANT